MGDQAAHWKTRAVASWRQHGLEARLRELLDVTIDPSVVEASETDTRASLDGVTFILKPGNGELQLQSACPRCHKEQPPVAVETISDVGRVMDSLCRDCDFLVRSGMASVSDPKHVSERVAADARGMAAA
ncbi:MAG: hypothetical protein KGJ86_06665 [Chloroflexota bacterium]|nr:hypothetical protein [Chloroflexota bacterium]